MPAPVARLDGRYAEASLGGTLIAVLTEWEVTVETDTADATAHGDMWQFPLPLDSGWRVRCRGWIVPGSAAHYINAYYPSGAAGVIATIIFRGYSGTVAGGTLIFEGTVFPVRGNLSAPMTLAEQEIEFVGYGVPTVGV
jgi:hypothetical protein